MLIPAFKLDMKSPILPGLAVVGKYDGLSPCLTCATTAGRVFIHSPHERDQFTNAEMQHLNINRKITAIAAGVIDARSTKDALLVGAQTTLFAYDIRNNADIFYKDVPDGVNAMKVGMINAHDQPLAIVGGNCSIQGFDHEGAEQFWTVTGDNVACLEFCDVDSDGRMEMLVGSEDFEIRIFQDEEVVSEVTETAAVVGLAALRGTRYGYALANGTIGVYDRNQRVWRVKSKHTVSAIAGFDLDGDGEPELISGWTQGRLEVRSDRTGEVIYKDNLNQAVAAIVKADYRKDGNQQVIVCGADGEVRAYLPADAELNGNLMDANVELDTLHTLTERRAELQAELKSVQDNMKAAASGQDEAGLIPTSTKVSTSLSVSRHDRCVYLKVQSSTPDARVRAVCIFADQIFEGESHVAHDAGAAQAISVQLAPAKDVSALLAVNALVGGRGSSAYHVFELSARLPKFAMYARAAPEDGPEAASFVKLKVGERMPQVKKWVQGAFAPDVVPDDAGPGFSGLHVVSLRTGRRLGVLFENGVVTVQTDEMELAGDVVQDLCAALQLSELESDADFPSEMAAFQEVLARVDELNAVRLRMTADMADSSNLIKQLVLRAEDARMLGEIAMMRKAYTQLHALNQELIGEYRKRTNNHDQLLEALKEVNHMIQKAARLRAGQAKGRIVASCRNAIKSNNIHALFKIIQSGKE
ncbi:hypothetical protein KFE25_003104 [Diacronema lutheri]|uniref:Bardet-Biedl syndrome 2 protein homolog n=3 Tax=Diacronema lutheri TaxID=2081491 RepID=A0A8J5XCQ5_DIALT|nr:hypothetical protein KFE25_003104 [Diacronema lutheri]